MNSDTLENIWKNSKNNQSVKVRFNDWNHQIKFFVINAESSDGKRFVGTLDTGEKISFAKQSGGWSLYHPESEYGAKAV